MQIWVGFNRVTIHKELVCLHECHCETFIFMLLKDFYLTWWPCLQLRILGMKYYNSWWWYSHASCCDCVIENILDCWYRVWVFYGIISTECFDLFDKFYIFLNDICQCQVKSKNNFLMLFHLFVQVWLVSSTNKSTLLVKWRKIEK